ncbi:MAG: glutathione S-transferase family protein [Alphaproteobacteria bacterium]|nr:glutathione S-transferase family protein [Alphaproteobacteria bacterium]MCW5739286.1 glutathione S-transferase family protein [Alphaproteobacteria bacterium]
MLTIYGVPVSVHTRKVIVTALLKGLQFRVEPVVPFNPPANWAELSPTGKIPVADIDGFRLADSTVICAYLERVHPAPSIHPQDAKAHAQALWFEEYADGTLFRDVVHGLFFNKVIRPGILKEPTDNAAVATIIDDVAPVKLAYLDGALAGDYFAGGQLSIADIAIASNLVNFHYLGYEIDKARYPKLAAHFRRMLTDKAFAAALEAEKGAAESMKLDRSFLGVPA